MYERYITLKLVVDDEKITEIFERLERAKEEIRECCHELYELGILETKNSPAGENGEGKN